MNYIKTLAFRLDITRTVIAVIAIFSLLGSTIYVYGAGTSSFSQTINTGTLATDIRSDATTSVSSPAVAMSAKTFSFSCQSGGSASTGTFGTSGERIYVDNPDGADNGWTLTVAPSAISAVWTQGGNTFDFNDGGGSGCTDGGDADSVAGQMTINPAVGSITTDYSGSSTTGITLGSSTAYVSGTTDSVTLVTAANTSPDVWRGYFTGFSLSQTIPAEQAAAAYTLSFVLTATAS